jgi:U3 small nucleolar RNA-associated protein 23
MRVKRQKKYKKYINFYKVVYKFHPPYKIMVDGNFFHNAVSNGFNLKDTFYQLINDTPLLVMTKCVMRELEQLGRSKIGRTLDEAKRVIKESCKHPGGIISADDCVRNFIGKKNEAKVFVGTNDEDLRNDLRNLGTVPIFFFKHSMLVMDAPTEVTEEKHRMVRLVFVTLLIERATEDRADQTGEGFLERAEGAN